MRQLELTPAARRLLLSSPRQPDARTCGAATLVVAHALRHESYADHLANGADQVWRAEVWGMHRRVTSPVSVSGSLQWPWTRRLGTPPWSVAAQLEGTRQRRHCTIRVRSGDQRGRAVAALVEATEAGYAVPLFVGTRLLPRHVMLALSPEAIYDPASGRVRDLELGQLLAGRLTPGWPMPWWVVLPQSVSAISRA